MRWWVPMQSWVSRTSIACTAARLPRRSIWRAARWHVLRRRHAVRRAARDLRSGGTRLAGGGAGGTRRARRHRLVARHRLACRAAWATSRAARAGGRCGGGTALAGRARQADSAGIGIGVGPLAWLRQSARGA